MPNAGNTGGQRGGNTRDREGKDPSDTNRRRKRTPSGDLFQNPKDRIAGRFKRLLELADAILPPGKGPRFRAKKRTGSRIVSGPVGGVKKLG